MTATRWTQPGQTSEMTVSASEPDQPYCPECGRSLDRSRHADVPRPRGTLEPWAQVIFGVILLLLFGIQLPHGYALLVSVDREIADDRVAAQRDVSGDPGGMLQTRGYSELLVYRMQVKRTFERAEAGFALGVVATAIGIFPLVCARRQVIARGSGTTGVGPLTSRPAAGVGALVLVGTWVASVARGVVRVLMVAAGVALLMELLRGTPLTAGLVEQVLDRTIDRAIAVVGLLGIS